jgi:hypothetical protein
MVGKRGMLLIVYLHISEWPEAVEIMSSNAPRGMKSNESSKEVLLCAHYIAGVKAVCAAPLRS